MDETRLSHTVDRVPSGAVFQVWTHIQSMLLEALNHARGELTLEDVQKALHEGEMQLWLVSGVIGGVQAVIATEVSNYPRFRVVRIVLAAGHGGDKWGASLEKRLIAWCKEIGAERIEACCRPSIARLLRKWKFHNLYTVVCRDLRNLH